MLATMTFPAKRRARRSKLIAGELTVVTVTEKKDHNEMSDGAILAVIGIIGTISASTIAGGGWLGSRVYDALKECAKDRLSLTGIVGKLQVEVSDCVEDRADLRSIVNKLNERLERVDSHLQATDKRVAKNAEDNT